LDLKQLFADSVCCSLVPFHALHGLFGRPDLHPARVEGVKIIGVGDMPVQRDGIELGQDGNLKNLRIYAVADRNIN
jgi:hypothetical protein